MKKLLLFVIACTLGLFGTVSAQETITIGNGEQSNYSLPIEAYYLNTYSQQSYTKAEIEAAGGEAGTITSIAFHVSAVSTSIPTRSLRVYMNNIDTTEEITFCTAAGNPNYPLPNLDGLVFEGDVTFADGWVTIPFTTPFTYNGNHLLITVMNDTNDSDNADIYFYVHLKTDWDNDGNPITWASNGNSSYPMDPTAFPGGLPNGVRNNIQLTFAAAGEGGEELASEFSFDFEDGTLTGWRTFAGDDNTAPAWAVSTDSYYYGNGLAIYSLSYDPNTYNTYMANNYVVTENAYVITAESKLSWYVKHTYENYAFADIYEVVISEDGENFTQIWRGTYDGTNAMEISLAEYAGQNLYIGFRHECTDNYGGDAIVLDDIVLTAGEGGEEPETPVAPAAPIVIATATETAITLTWDAVENATSYNIYTPSGFATNIFGLTETTYTFEDLTAGTYCFQVSAVNDVDESDATEACATIEETEEPGEGGEGGEEPGEIYIVEVGADKSPNTYNNYNLPVYDYQAYSVSQQIYTAADLGAVGDIHSIAFKLGNSTSAVTRQYEVYLSTTELGSYSNYNFIAVTEADKVFDGNVEISGVQDSWLTINFDKEFPYSGGNLVLTVYDKTGVALPNGYHTFYKYATAGMNGLNKKGSSPYDMSNMGTGGSFYYINQIQLGMELDPTPTAPQGLAATATSSSEIALTWGAVVVAESYNIYAGTELVAANVEGTSYTVEGLTPATEYCFTVTAVNELGESAASTEACATTKMLAPATPANLSVASVGEMSVSLTWDAVATAESYKVYQGETVVATNVTATEYTVEGLASATEYCFTVAAVNNGGESAKSEQACGTTLEFTGCYVHFTLTDSYGDGWNYNTLTVSYGTASQTLTLSSGTTVTHIVPIPQNAVVTLTYTVVGSYSYPGENGFVVSYESGKEIISVDQGSLSATKTFDAFTVDCGPAAPDAPVVTATNTTSTTIVLAMEVFGAEKYNVYQGEELVASVTEKTYTVEGLEANTEYCFSVTAENSLGESEATEVCATTKMYAPAAPANLTATTTGYFTIALAWEASATAESYNIYQGENLVATNVTATEYTVEGLTHDTEYCFTVKAVNNGGESAASESACDTTEEYDGCFVNFTLSDQWNDSWDGDYLVVAYDAVTEQLDCPSQASPKTYTLPIPQGTEVTATYTKTSNYPREKGIVITYESGKEILNIAQGSLSETTSWEFVVDCTPEAPSIATVVAEATSDETVVLTMEAVGAESFNIYLGEELVATTTENVYTVEGLTPETEYCFTVEAVNEVGKSEELSEAACATTYKEGTAVVQIGEGTDYYVQTSPVNEFYSYSISQTVYTAEEIGFGAGIIKSISYNQYSGNNNTRNLSVFMKNVGEDVNLTSAWETLTEDLLVYDGEFTFGISGWTEIKLQKDFVYEGGNLLVCVLDKTGSYAYNYDMFYTYLTGSTIRSIYAGYSQTIDPYNINVAKNGLYNNNYNAVAPQAKFVIEPAEGGDDTDPETPSTDNNRLVSVTQDNNWDNLTYVYESQTSNKVIRVLKGVDQGYGVYVTVLEYDDNGVITGSEYKWLQNGELTTSNYIDEYEYTYTEGVLTSYTQASGYDYYGTPTPVEYVLTHDANGNVETVVYETNKIVYTYEDGKLVKEVMSYVMNGVEETEYEVDYAYENGNCISATQYSVLEGERIARKATEYFYDLTVEAEDVFSFVYPHEVKPASVNVLTKELSYEYQEDYFSGAITKSNIKILTYNYNFEVESVSFPPMGLSARAISDTQIELSWVATEETEKFAVYQNDTYIGESESTYFTVEGLTANTEYCFTVTGVNGEVESEASEAACAKTMDVISVDPTTIAFGELRLGEYWSESEVTVGVSINRLGKTITSITCDDTFFTLPTDIDLTSEYIWFEMGYDKTAAAGEYTATLTVTLESGVTVEIPVTATAYAPATPDVFELAQAVTFTEGVYTDTPDFATLHDDYAMPNENEWDETDAPDAVYSFTLEEESVVSVSVTGDNAAYAIFQAEGFEAPYEGNVFTGEVKNLNTEFVYNFDNNSLADFTIVDNDEYKDFTWAIEEGEKGYQLVSYSYYGWYAEDNSYTYIDKADERLITNNAYPISAKSVLSFDMNVNGTFEEIIIEVTKDGETFTEIERITETSYSYDWLAKSVNVGEKLAELGLEYGDYQIVLYHKVDGYGELNIDNLVLAERVRTYPVGEYYLFAAAESAFTVEVNATPAKDVTFEPEIPVAKAYRLESIESFNVESYVYDEIYTNRVLSYVGSDGLDYILTYNKAGQLETVKSVSIIEGEEPQVISSIEYAYNEDGTLASYSESSPHPVTGAMFTTTTEYTYENGRLVKAENADYEVETTLGYNEDGTVKEIVESYMTTIMTYENGKLVKKAYGYEDEETGEFVTDAEDIYTYDANGNCVKQESYEYGKLYQVYEFFYDVKIAAEDVYSFELPHLAMTNVEPSSNNILVKKLSYYSYFNEEVGEVLTHSYDVTIYHYNPAVEMAPITPINLVAEVVDGVVELTWEKFIDAETFTVYQEGEIIAQNVEEGAYTVEDLGFGEYCFAVRAYNKAGASATTEEVCVGYYPIPAAPVVTAEATSDSTIVLTWDAVEGATNYNVYSADTLVANVTVTTYTVTGLEAEKEYCFNVTAVNEVGGESAKSEKACATTLKEGNDPVVLEAPVVQVVEITETTIVIAWNQVESATNYKVFANDQLITTLPDTIAGFRELTPNTEYCFTVVAINEVGDESAPSEKVCATTSGEGIAENAAAFNIYPNPVADKLFIETEATVEEVTIYTLTGVMIYSEVDYNNNTINVSDLSGGVYFIKVRTDNGEVVKRFIKK